MLFALDRLEDIYRTMHRDVQQLPSVLLTLDQELDEIKKASWEYQLDANGASSLEFAAPSLVEQSEASFLSTVCNILGPATTRPNPSPFLRDQSPTQSNQLGDSVRINGATSTGTAPRSTATLPAWTSTAARAKLAFHSTTASSPLGDAQPERRIGRSIDANDNKASGCLGDQSPVRAEGHQPGRALTGPPLTPGLAPSNLPAS